MGIVSGLKVDRFYQFSPSKGDVFARWTFSLFARLVGFYFAYLCIFLHLGKVQFMLVISFGHHFLCDLSDGSPHHSFGGRPIQIKLADSPVLLFRFVVIHQLPIFEDPPGHFHPVEETSLSIGLVHQPISLVKSTITPEHLPASVSQI